jgi:alkylation response protein AidB-like acyl-CoA dehydrogenase
MNQKNLTGSYMQQLDSIIENVIAPSAAEVDRSGSFPHASIEALKNAGLLGLISARDAGGMGEAHRAATFAVERIASACGSTAMVLCMHYSATAVMEAHAPLPVRQAIAGGRHLSTLAFSESGSRSHFWAPLGTATKRGSEIELNAQKSFVTSAGKADSYVWSSRASSADGITLWLVPSSAKGLRIPKPFEGLGLRGTASSAVTAESVIVPDAAILGNDGGGFDIMMGIVLPYFQLMSAGISIGLMQAAASKAIQHVAKTRLDHLNQSLADLPTIRAYLSKMQIKIDAARALLLDALDALEAQRPDAMLRVLQVKAAAADAGLEATELAMRVCGGAAFSKETGVERNFRDARAASIMAPTSDALYDFIGKALCGLPLFA